MCWMKSEQAAAKVRKAESSMLHCTLHIYLHREGIIIACVHACHDVCLEAFWQFPRCFGCKLNFFCRQNLALPESIHSKKVFVTDILSVI